MMHGRAVDIRSNGETNLHTLKISRLLAALLLAVVMSGCDQFPVGGSVNATTVVVELEAVAKVTGQDTVIAEKMTTMREELNIQLNDFVADLEQQLVEAKAELGDSSDEAAQQRFQEIAAQAQQQLAQQRTLVQQKAQQYQTGLVLDFRKTVEPVAAKIASARGASVILIYDPMMLWFDPSIDITDEVIGALRDQSVEFSLSDIETTPTAEIDETPGGLVEEALPAAE